jgi:hypothetical protein
MLTNSSLTFKAWIGRFINKLFNLVQNLYFWFKVGCNNIDKYFDNIKKQTHITLDPSRVSDKSCAKKMIIFLPLTLKNLYSIKDLMFSS